MDTSIPTVPGHEVADKLPVELWTKVFEAGCNDGDGFSLIVHTAMTASGVNVTGGDLRFSVSVSSNSIDRLFAVKGFESLADDYFKCSLHANGLKVRIFDPIDSRRECDGVSNDMGGNGSFSITLNQLNKAASLDHNMDPEIILAPAYAIRLTKLTLQFHRDLDDQPLKLRVLEKLLVSAVNIARVNIIIRAEDQHLGTRYDSAARKTSNLLSRLFTMMKRVLLTGPERKEKLKGIIVQLPGVCTRPGSLAEAAKDHLMEAGSGWFCRAREAKVFTQDVSRNRTITWIRGGTVVARPA